MLYNMDWLQEGLPFPPLAEQTRLDRYNENKLLFDSEHFSDSHFRHRNFAPGEVPMYMSMYDACAERIGRVVGNFDQVISFPVLLNYQRFISVKIADLVAGEHPLITGKDDAESEKIKWVLDMTNFYEKLYAMVIDLSRYGDCPIRIYKNEFTGYYDWTIWDAGQWFPIVMQDGTYRIKEHCLAWLEDKSQDVGAHDFYLHVQEFDVTNPKEITEYLFHNGVSGATIGHLVEGYPRKVTTGFTECPVFNVKQFSTSGTVFGYDDYIPLDSLLAEIMTRVSQISVILDKHADPSMTGPRSLLRKNSETGEWYFERSKFYGINEEDTAPSYLTWDGKLDAAFKQLEVLINQLYTLSEMGAAITGGIDSSGNAVSGTAMRFKMVSPLTKARRITNSLTTPLRKLLAVLCSNVPDIDIETAAPGSGKDTKLPYGHISIMWKDGLPDDPRENLEMCKLASGKTEMLPLEDSLMTYLNKTQVEAQQLANELREEAKQLQQEQVDPNKSGPQDGTGINPNKKGSKGSLGNFQAETNKKTKDK